MSSALSRAYLALAVAGSLWGTGFLFGKLVLPDLSVSHLILSRLVFACAGFIPVLAGRWTTVGRDDWPRVLLAGVVGVPLVYVIQFEGLARTTVAHASLMVGAMPILLGLELGHRAPTPVTCPTRLSRAKRACAIVLIEGAAKRGRNRQVLLPCEFFP